MKKWDKAAMRGDFNDSLVVARMGGEGDGFHVLAYGERIYAENPATRQKHAKEVLFDRGCGIRDWRLERAIGGAGTTTSTLLDIVRYWQHQGATVEFAGPLEGHKSLEDRIGVWTARHIDAFKEGQSFMRDAFSYEQMWCVQFVRAYPSTPVFILGSDEAVAAPFRVAGIKTTFYGSSDDVPEDAWDKGIMLVQQTTGLAPLSLLAEKMVARCLKPRSPWATLPKGVPIKELGENVVFLFDNVEEASSRDKHLTRLYLTDIQEALPVKLETVACRRLLEQLFAKSKRDKYGDWYVQDWALPDRPRYFEDAAKGHVTGRTLFDGWCRKELRRRSLEEDYIRYRIASGLPVAKTLRLKVASKAEDAVASEPAAKRARLQVDPAE